MRICLLTNQDLLHLPLPDDDWPCDPRPYYPEAQWEGECLEKRTAVEQVARRIKRGFDVFFNLCDGAADQNTPGIEVVHTLEKHNVAFTGATSEFYEPSRAASRTSNGQSSSCAFPFSSSITAVIPASTFPGDLASVRRLGCGRKRARC